MTIRPRRSLSNAELQRPSALNSTPRNPQVLWLDKNENLDPELMKLSHEVLSSIPLEVLATYPEAGELYRKLASWVGVSADSLLLTPGSDGAIRLVFEAFVEHGDAVVHTLPTCAMYPVYSQMFGANARQINYARTAGGRSWIEKPFSPPCKSISRSCYACRIPTAPRAPLSPRRL